MRSAALIACFALVSLGACATDPGPSRLEQTSNGEVMTTPKGLTLYAYQRDIDDPGSSTCVGACAEMFPPFLVSPSSLARARRHSLAGPIADRSADADTPDYPLPYNNTWGTVRRPDGSLQWAHAGTPLYTYHRDILPGDRQGEGLYGLWHIARPESYGE